MAAAAAAPGVGEGPAALPAQPLELKSQFRTREGSYRLLGPEPRPRAGPVAAPGPSPPAAGPGPAAAAAPGPAALPPVRLSMVRLALPPAEEPGSPAERSRVCFNLGRELYFYGGAGSGGRGSRRSLDLHKPIDKRIYKGTQPTCHDFNQFTAAADTIALLVGFSAGQVQYLDLVKKDTSKLFNEERLIDKTKVTFVKWLPETERLFLASHASGHLYLYDAEQPCGGATAPQYNLLTQGEGFSVFACKSKTPRNPLLKWVVGEGALNEFAFSPDGRSLACVSQDGCLRVFHFDSMLLQGMMKSYFGGLLCVCWSPDGRYVVTGGEDDLVTVWSFAEGRVVARGHGHKSWVNAVAFDPFTGAAQSPQSAQLSGGGEEEEEPPDPLVRRSPAVTYRFGSAGQDTQFCLWDLTEDVLYPRPPLSRARTLTASGDATVPVPGLPRSLSRSNSLPQPAGTGSARGPPPDAPPAFSVGRFATLTLQERKGPSGTEKEHKRYHSLGNISRSGEKNPSGTGSRGRLDTAKVLGTALCPRIHEVPLLEPLVCKKIAHERLTVLLFLEDCIVTACQEGLICTWARPGKAGLSSQNGGSPSGTVV